MDMEVFKMENKRKQIRVLERITKDLISLDSEDRDFIFDELESKLNLVIDSKLNTEPIKQIKEEMEKCERNFIINKEAGLNPITIQDLNYWIMQLKKVLNEPKNK